MDGTAAIQRNLEALKGVVASLVAMAGLTGVLTSPLWGGRREASRCTPTTPPTRRSGDRRPPHSGEVEPEFPTTLPRRLHRAILSLLRPAEAAARRLIIAAARGLVVTLPPRRAAAPQPKTIEPVLRRLGIAVTMSRADLRRAAAAKKAAAMRAARPRSLCLPLFDPPRRPSRAPCVAAHAAPRILFPGFSEPFSLPAPPSPDDRIDAAPLGRRLAALAAALDDLPRQARRFARWQAARDAAGAQGKNHDAAGAQSRNRDAAGAQKGPGSGRFRRMSPLRTGRPPGGRLSRFDPSATHSRKIREVDEILAHAHALAVYALDRPDTS